MKLSEAIKIIRDRDTTAGPTYSVFVASGFTPLHLGTFLNAHLCRKGLERHVVLTEGLFGDLFGNIDRLRSAVPDLGIVFVEWQDLDPRLGFRSLGGWGPEALPDILNFAEKNSSRIVEKLSAAAERVPLAISLPHLPMPPVSFSPKERLDGFGAGLRKIFADLSIGISAIAGAKCLNSEVLDGIVPKSERLDLKSELMSGFPYTLEFASLLACKIATLVFPTAPKKGLITDLDNTVWKGIVGDDGIKKISWHLDNGSHIHGLYQQLLNSLADSGVLIAVASKNSPEIVSEALLRKDLVLRPENIFPIEANWGPKSASVERILNKWNIAPDAVVFVDDNPMELAEVTERYPDIEAVLFPTDMRDFTGAMYAIRDRFAKASVTEEDRIRLRSLRLADEGGVSAGGEDMDSGEDFLSSLEGELRLSRVTRSDTRSFELINKTNQFNLNGRRLTEADLLHRLGSADNIAYAFSYQDRFGPLGKISVLLGHLNENSIVVDVWVMSCRAFSRRIEHAIVDHIFEKFGVSEIVFDAMRTERNSPLFEFLNQLVKETQNGSYIISREDFAIRKPELYHIVSEE